MLRVTYVENRSFNLLREHLRDTIVMDTVLFRRSDKCSINSTFVDGRLHEGTDQHRPSWLS